MKKVFKKELTLNGIDFLCESFRGKAEGSFGAETFLVSQFYAWDIRPNPFELKRLLDSKVCVIETEGKHFGIDEVVYSFDLWVKEVSSREAKSDEKII